MNRISKIFLIIGGILILGNIGFLDYKMIKSGKVPASPKTASRGGDVGREVGGGSESGITTKSVECAENCQNQIAQKVQEEVAKIVIPTGAVVYKTQPQASTNTESKVVYVPLSTSGSLETLTWTNIFPSEFYFDLSDYPGAKEVRFIAYVLSGNGDLGSARLFDDTNKRGVDHSELETRSTTFARVESSGMSIWRGNNKYTIQLKSVNGTLVQLKEAKLKIIY